MMDISIRVNGRSAQVLCEGKPEDVGEFQLAGFFFAALNKLVTLKYSEIMSVLSLSDAELETSYNALLRSMRSLDDEN